MAEVKLSQLLLNRKNYPTWKEQCQLRIVCGESEMGIDPGARSKEARKITYLKHGGANAAAEVDVEQILSSDDEAFVVDRVFSVTSKENCSIDSGVTCHMCNDQMLFSDLNVLKRPQEVSLGDGHVLEATGEGTVPLRMLLLDGNSKIAVNS